MLNAGRDLFYGILGGNKHYESAISSTIIRNHDNDPIIVSKYQEKDAPLVVDDAKIKWTTRLTLIEDNGRVTPVLHPGKRRFISFSEYGKELIRLKLNRLAINNKLGQYVSNNFTLFEISLNLFVQNINLHGLNDKIKKFFHAEKSIWDFIRPKDNSIIGVHYWQLNMGSFVANTNFKIGNNLPAKNYKWFKATANSENIIKPKPKGTKEINELESIKETSEDLEKIMNQISEKENFILLTNDSFVYAENLCEWELNPDNCLKAVRESFSVELDKAKEELMELINEKIRIEAVLVKKEKVSESLNKIMIDAREAYNKEN